MKTAEVLHEERHQAQHDDSIVLTLHIPATLCYFPDHFAHFPLLPGVVQIDWAARYAQHYFALTGAGQRLEQVKFQAVIKPDDTVQLSLKFEREKQRISFSYDSLRGRHASGRIVFI